MGKIFTGVLGALGLGDKKPKTSTAPVVETEDAKKKAKSSRSALLQTEGGIIGQELSTGQVSSRDTLLGN